MNTSKMMVAILNVIYPVGSIIVYSESETRSPSQIIGGKWELLDGGRILALQKKVIDEVTKKYTPIVGKKGGETNHTLTISEMPEHRHYLATNKESSQGDGILWGNIMYLDGKGDAEFERNTPSAGGGLSHENMPPYRVVSIWRRTE